MKSSFCLTKLNYLFYPNTKLKTLLVFTLIYTPKGIRIPVTSVKGRCPRPLDDGGNETCIWKKQLEA